MNRFAEPRGFTLVELLVVLLIAAMLMALATPALQGLVTSNQLTALTDDFVATLNLARSEAGRIGSNVSVTSGGGNWGRSGWSVGAGGGAPALRSGGPVPTNYSLNANDPYDDQPVTFDPTGRAVNGSGRFMLCQGGGPPNGAARLILVSASGQVRISQNYNSAGWPLDGNNPVTDCDAGG